MAFVVMCHRLCATSSSVTIRAASCTALASGSFRVTTQYPCMLGWQHVQSNDVLEFYPKPGFVQNLEATNQVGPQALCLIVPHHRTGADTNPGCHLARASVRCRLGFALRGRLHQNDGRSLGQSDAGAHRTQQLCQLCLLPSGQYDLGATRTGSLQLDS